MPTIDSKIRMLRGCFNMDTGTMAYHKGDIGYLTRCVDETWYARFPDGETVNQWHDTTSEKELKEVMVGIDGYNFEVISKAV